MDAREFVDLLDNPKVITPKLLEDLSRVVKQYPFFSMAVLAYLKGLKECDDPHFSSFLSYAATHAQSGEWLYLFLNSSGDSWSPGLPEEAELAAEAAVVAADSTDTVEAADSVVTDTLAEQPVDEPQIAQELSTTAGHTAPTEDSFVVQNRVDETENSDATAAFSDNAQFIDEDEVVFELIDDEMEAERLNEDPIFEILDQKLYTLDETANTLEVQNSLIDQFLTTNPRITPKGELPPVIEDISVKSLVDDGEIVTEMLAKIYTGQGLIAKAINVYEKLILKYPEKRAYFVAELEKLKESK